MMKSVVLILAIVLVSFSGSGEETVSLKYDFAKGRVVTIEVVHKANAPREKTYDRLVGKMILKCETEEVINVEDSEEANKLLTFKSFSVKHLKGEEDVPLRESLEEGYKEENERLRRQLVRIRQKEDGHLTHLKKKDPERRPDHMDVDELLFRDFKKHVAIPLPHRPVKLGDKWKNPYFEPLGEKEYRSHIDVEEYEYVGNEEVDGVQCAKIVGENYRENPYTSRRFHVDPDSEEGKKLKDKTEYTMVYEVIFFDTEKGRLVKQEISREDAFFDHKLPGSVQEFVHRSKHVVTYFYKDEEDGAASGRESTGGLVKWEE